MTCPFPDEIDVCSAVDQPRDESLSEFVRRPLLDLQISAHPIYFRSEIIRSIRFKEHFSFDSLLLKDRSDFFNDLKAFVTDQDISRISILFQVLLNLKSVRLDVLLVSIGHNLYKYHNKKICASIAA